MKVLHVLNTVRFSGAEQMLFSAAPVLLADGMEHTVLSTGDTLGEFAPRLRERGYRSAHLPLRRNPAYFAAFGAFVRRHGFDVVHVHTERAGFWFCLAALLAGARCVRTIHNVFAYDGTLRWRRRVQRRLLRRLGVPLVACSALVCRNESQRFGVDATLIDNWVDPDRFRCVSPAARATARRDLGLEDDAFVLVSVGNCGPAKNHGAIIRALAQLPRTLGARYLHLGTGAHQADEEQLAAELSVRQSIAFVPHAANPEDYLTAADAYISTSHFEGGQIALLEAAATGVPCVTTRVGLADEFEGQANVHFVRDDTADIVGAITGIAAQPLAERLAHAVALSDYTRGRFVPAVGASRYVALYHGRPPAAAPAGLP
jgi:glycosyltransferase involved in cell wall biosynthesis